MATVTPACVGKSVRTAIPKEFRGPGFEVGDKVTIEFGGRSLRLSPVRELMTLQSLMRGCEGLASEALDFGAMMGSEHW